MWVASVPTSQGHSVTLGAQTWLQALCGWWHSSPAEHRLWFYHRYNSFIRNNPDKALTNSFKSLEKLMKALFFTQNSKYDISLGAIKMFAVALKDKRESLHPDRPPARLAQTPLCSQ